MTPAMEHKLLGWFLLVMGYLLVASRGVSGADCSGPPAFTPTALEQVSAGFRQYSRGAGVTTDVTHIEVTAIPFLMVVNPACYDKTKVSLEMKAGAAAAWAPVEESPKEKGGKYRWILKVLPCHDHYFRLHVGDGAVLELPKPVSAASAEDIINSKFDPEPPQDLTVNSQADGSLRVSWTPSECATSYIFYYNEEGSNDAHTKMVDAKEGSSTVIKEGLRPCRDYALTAVASVRGTETDGKEITASFSTPPDASAAAQLEPKITADVSGLRATWSAYDVLSCVNNYEVSVCEAGAAACESTTLALDSLPYMEFKKAGLKQCAAFTLSIRPLYGNLNLAPKVTGFQTLSPPVTDVIKELHPVTATKGEGQMVFLAWSAVTCADHYLVFQKVTSGAAGDWEQVGKTTETSLVVNTAPCTTHRYGVKVTVGGHTSQIVEVAEAITTSLDKAAPFVVPNLAVVAKPTSALLTWDHAACIASYVLSTCTTAAETADKLCERTTVEAQTPEAHHVSYEVGSLRPCSDYTIEIVPVVEGAELPSSASTPFSTAYPPATPPASYTATLNQNRNRVELSWSQVECASGYRILQRMGSSNTTTAWETKDGKELFTSFQDPEPCVVYRYPYNNVCIA
jgi:hypothetical protein